MVKVYDGVPATRGVRIDQPETTVPVQIQITAHRSVCRPCHCAHILPSSASRILRKFRYHYNTHLHACVPVAYLARPVDLSLHATQTHPRTVCPGSLASASHFPRYCAIGSGTDIPRILCLPFQP